MQPGFPRGQAGKMVLAGRRRTIAFFIPLGARLRCAIFLTPTAAGQRRRPSVVDRDQALGFRVAEGHMGGPETGRQKLCQPCNIWRASTQAPSSSHSGSRYVINAPTSCYFCQSSRSCVSSNGWKPISALIRCAPHCGHRSAADHAPHRGHLVCDCFVTAL